MYTRNFTTKILFIMILSLFATGMYAAVIPVTSSADSGMGSLRAAISMAQPGDTIVFDATTNGNPIILSSGQIAISQSVTIIGNGPDNTVLSGNNTNRIFDALNVMSFHLEGIGFMNGFTSDNGGAVNLETVNGSITNCTFSNNLAGTSGGAICNFEGSFTISNTMFSNNTANGLLLNQGGGAITNANGTLNVIENCVFDDNVADGAAGSGGAILNISNGTLNVTEATFSRNIATRAGGGIEDNSGAMSMVTLIDVDFIENVTGPSPGNGGAVHITGPGNMDIIGGSAIRNVAALEGGGYWNGTGVMNIENVFIDDNEANGDGADDGGGGVFNKGGTLNIKSSTITNNRAEGAAGSGGGVFNDEGGTMTIEDTDIDNNIATRAGGGFEDNSGAGTLVTLINVNFRNNFTGSAPGNGGAVHITGPGDMDISGGEITGNIAAREGGGLWNGSGIMNVDNVFIDDNEGNGPAANDGGGGVFNNGGTININNSIITNNRAEGMAGSGGGVFNEVGGTLNIQNTTISNNIASRAGGGLEDNSGAGTLVTLTNVIFRDNITGSTPGNGGAVHITGPGDMNIVGGEVTGNIAALEGGGLWNGTGIMNVDGVLIDNNEANGDAADDGGGGVFNKGGTVNIMNSTITNNRAEGAAGSGGGVFNDVGGTMTIIDTDIDDNRATRAGGGLEDLSGAGTLITLTNVNFRNNFTGSAPGNGGAVHITGPGDMNISGGEIRGNVAAREGGGLWNGTGIMNVEDVLIDDNEANGDAANDGGGGVFNNGGTINIMNATITNNRADGMAGSGGGVFNEVGGTLTIANTTINSNSASRAGGGLEDNSGAGTLVTLTDVIFRFNVTGSAPGNGGAVHITGPGDMNITGGEVTGNIAALEGGGLWNGTGVMNVDGVFIDDNEANGNGADDGGGGVFNKGGIINIVNTTITNNRAEGTEGSGGGIFNDLGGSMTIENTDINDNRASRAGGGLEDNSREGTLVTLVNVNFRGNFTGNTPGNGGAVHITGPGDMDITGGEITGNVAAREGGGLWNGTGIMNVDDVLIDDNEGNGPAANDGGGGVFNNGGTINIMNSIITNNRADVMSGSGGGVFNEVGGTMTISNTIISNNSAARAGGGLEDNSGAGTLVTLVDVIFRDNFTGSTPGNGGAVHITGPGDMNITGGEITGNVAAQEGGGLWNGSGIMNVDNVFIDDNEGNGDEAHDGGGGVFNNGGLINIRNSIITNNRAEGMAGSGGGVFNEVGGSLFIENTEINDNRASRAGGGLEDNSGAGTLVTLIDVNFSGNFTGNTPGNGGAIHITGPGDMNITRGVYVDNVAAREGGALWNGTGVMNVDSVTIDSNTANGQGPTDGGGGVFNNGGILNINASTISNNLTDGMSGNGGGVHNIENGTINITNSTISMNETQSQGGGVYNNGTMTIVTSTVANNTAMADGGGVSQGPEGVSTTLSSSIIAANTAGTSGTDIYSASSNVTSVGFNLIGLNDNGDFDSEMSDIVGMGNNPINPMLEMLADNGGPTLTHALICGSPALGAGDPDIMTMDQRGFMVMGDRRDIGAFTTQDTCITISTRDIERLTGSEIFPNPATTNTITIDVPEHFGRNIKIRMMEMSTGRTVQFMETSFGTFDFSLNQAPSGNYIIQIISELGSESHKLILVN